MLTNVLNVIIITYGIIASIVVPIWLTFSLLASDIYSKFYGLEDDVE